MVRKRRTGAGVAAWSQVQALQAPPPAVMVGGCREPRGFT